jgi:hypothetical protein
MEIKKLLLPIATLTATLAFSATTFAALHLVVKPASAANLGMTGKQACQDYWLGAPTCIPTLNNESADTLHVDAGTYGAVDITPNQISALAGGTPIIKSFKFIVTDKTTGKVFTNTTGKNMEGIKCPDKAGDTKCVAWTS